MNQITSKLVVVTRQDLNNGYQAVQSGHAIAKFAASKKEIFDRWHKDSQYLVMLAARDIEHLIQQIEKIKKLDVEYVEFYEPDIGNQLTAFCFYAETSKAKKVLSNLPLALK